MDTIDLYETEKLKTALENGELDSRVREKLMDEALRHRISNAVMVLYNHGVEFPSWVFGQNEFGRMNDFEGWNFVCTGKEDFFEKLYRKTKRELEGIHEGQTEWDEDFPDDPLTPIYVFGFEYRHEYASVIISFNTIKEFEKRLKWYQAKYPGEYTAEKDINLLKYEPGDFAFQGTAEYVDRSYYFYNRLGKEDFEDVMRKVLERLDTDEVFDIIKKTADFTYDIWEYD